MKCVGRLPPLFHLTTSSSTSSNWGMAEEKVERFRNFCKAIDTELVVEKSQFGHSLHEFRFEFFGSHGSHGICASSEEFAASTAVLMAISAVLRDDVDRNLHPDPLSLAKKRLRFVLHWNSRAKQLQDEEASLRSTMDSVVSELTKSKRICLFEEMLTSAGYPDMGVVDELKRGVDLLGDVPETDMLPRKFSPAVLTEEGLNMQSALMRKSHREIACSSGDATVDETVRKQTLEEVDAGWFEGPLALQSVPTTSPISRRFGLVQKEKVRLIDDFSAAGVNSCVNVFESPSLRTIVVVAAMLAYWNGETNKVGNSAGLRIRTFDLSSAYRQLALSSKGRESAYIAVYDPYKLAGRSALGLYVPFILS